MTVEDEGDWEAGAFLFSGRPDPTWIVGRDAGKRLVERWQRLPPAEKVPQPRPVLGFRGCWLRRPDGLQLLSRDGVVLGKQGDAEAGGLTVRDDRDRRFERELLGTAPAGVLPGGIPD